MSDKMIVPAESLPGGGLVPAATPRTGAEVMEFARARKAAQVDLKFVDLPGQWQHLTVPISTFSANSFRAGLGFDASSVRGYQTTQHSDLLLIPDPTTACIDAFATTVPTLSLVCNVHDPVSGAPSTYDPRHVTQRAETWLGNSGIADAVRFGLQLEFFAFDSVRFDQNQYSSYYYVDSDEGVWNSGRESSGRPTLGHRPRPKEGYSPVAPLDTLHDMRAQITMTLLSLAIDVETHHHQVASAGQCGIALSPQSLTLMADHMLMSKYIIRNTAARNGKTATFMPRPLFDDNGSGLSVHQTLWKGDQALFHDAANQALLTEQARYYIGGLLKHAPALLAITSPTTNSYRRLAPGDNAPIHLAYSQHSSSAACRIPVIGDSPQSRYVDFRCPDALCNPYLALSAILLAGMDGIRNQIDPGEPLHRDVKTLPADQLAGIPTAPDSLAEALDALEKDHDFLLEGGVFTAELLEGYLRYKRMYEVLPMRQRPHPYEFYLYYEL